jgi:hypothetical protein
MKDVSALREEYVSGRIDVFEFEDRVDQVLGLAPPPPPKPKAEGVVKLEADGWQYIGRRYHLGNEIYLCEGNVYPPLPS